MSRADDLKSFGRECRGHTKRASHASWEPAPGRQDPVEIIEAENATRVSDLIPIRHARMAPSAFTFLRGSAAVMAADLAGLPRSGVLAQSCGDCHLSNFGVFATPERRLVFDVNDFDETFPAPFEWDVKRLATSFVVAGRDNGLDDDRSAQIVQRMIARYQAAVRRDADRAFLDVWYQDLDVATVLDALTRAAKGKALKRAERGVQKARSRNQLSTLAKLAQRTEEGWRIREQPPVIVRYPEREAAEPRLRALFEAYAGTLSADHQLLLGQYELADFARKVVGVGSVGTEVFIFLFIGPQGDDPLWLQLKQAEPSVLAAYIPEADPQPAHEGERVVRGQRLMQASSDVFLGWASGGPDGGQDFYVRQLRDMKGSAEIETMSARELGAYAELCGEALARAHARGGCAPAIAGYLGAKDAFASAVSRFALTYADQVQRDFEAFTAAIASGRLPMADAQLG